MAQFLTRVIDVTQDVVLAEPAQEFFRFVAGQVIGAFVPILDPPLPVYEVNAIANAVQKLLIEAGVDRNNRVLQFVRFDRSSPTLYPMILLGTNLLPQ
jgi:hypothetical protein